MNCNFLQFFCWLSRNRSPSSLDRFGWFHHHFPAFFMKFWKILSELRFLTWKTPQKPVWVGIDHPELIPELLSWILVGNRLLSINWHHTMILLDPIRSFLYIISYRRMILGHQNDCRCCWISAEIWTGSYGIWRLQRFDMFGEWNMMYWIILYWKIVFVSELESFLQR